MCVAWGGGARGGLFFSASSCSSLLRKPNKLNMVLNVHKTSRLIRLFFFSFFFFFSFSFFVACGALWAWAQH